MGKGIAKQIKETFPEAYEADRNTEFGDKSKLGSFSYAIAKIPTGEVTIINAYTQYNYNSPNNLIKSFIDYEALENVMKQIKKTCHGKRIGYPKIGAGLAGGDWSRISRIINETLQGEDHTLVVL